MMKLFRSWRLWVAKVLSRLFHYVCDPTVERDLAYRQDYEYFQQRRKEDVEAFLTRYLGPRA